MEEGRRVEFDDERGTVLRATWHDDLVVVSLWRDGLCIGTFRANAEDAAAISRFLSGKTRVQDAPTARTAPVRGERAATDATAVLPAVRGEGMADSA